MKIHRPYRKYNSTRGPHCPCGTTSPRAADLPGSKALDRGGRLGFGLSPASIRAFLVAQMVKDLPAIRETQVQSMGGEDPLEKAIATHSSILAGESHGQRSFIHGVAKSQTQLSKGHKGSRGGSWQPTPTLSCWDPALQLGCGCASGTGWC